MMDGIIFAPRPYTQRLHLTSCEPIFLPQDIAPLYFASRHDLQLHAVSCALQHAARHADKALPSLCRDDPTGHRRETVEAIARIARKLHVELAAAIQNDTQQSPPAAPDPKLGLLRHAALMSQAAVYLRAWEARKRDGRPHDAQARAANEVMTEAQAIRHELADAGFADEAAGLDAAALDMMERAVA